MSLLLRNARLVARDTAPVDTAPVDTALRDPAPVDILIKHGVVTGIGRDLEGTAEVDLGGRWVLPGLWDDHVHLTLHALAQRRVDVSAASSAADAARIMGAALRPEPGIPLVGIGYRDGLWPDAPTSALLDETVGEVPAVVVSGDNHACWLNAAALALFGHRGHPTGLLREDDAFPVITSLQEVPTEVLDAWVTAAADDAARRGVVGVVDLEMADTLSAWRRRFANGFRGLRVAAGIYPAWLDAAIRAGHRTGQVIAGTDGLLSVGPFKIITDGSLNTRTAYCVDPYPGLDGPDSRGLLTVPTGRLISLIRKASDAGLTPTVHAIGDEANRLALDAFEAAGCGGRIEHAQLLLDADVSRFAQLGVVASVQPEHAMDDRDVADRYWAGRTHRAFVLGSLLAAGARVALGSDAPVAPLDPWVTVAAAVGRGRDGRAPWHPEQAITTAQALASSAHGAVSIEVGDVADLAVVDINPLAASHEQLREMPVSATLLAGYFTHRSL